MMILILVASEIKGDTEKLSQQWENIADKPISKEIKAYIDELNMNADCCHSAPKTFTRNPLTGEEIIDSLNRERGPASSNDAQNEQNHITIFMSYNVPKSVWQSLWQEAQTLKQPIQFVLRGLPNNSFRELAKKILEYGCPVSIDPTLFERHHITAVPAFLVEDKGFFGNVSLACVLAKTTSQTALQEVQS